MTVRTLDREEPPHGRRVLLIGASRGPGLALAGEWLERGWEVVATTRGPHPDERRRTLVHTILDRPPDEVVDLEAADLEEVSSTAGSWGLLPSLGRRRIEHMFEQSVAALQADLADLAGRDGAVLSDAVLIDQITALEQLKAAACAAQARLTVAFDESVRRAAAARGVRGVDQGKGVAAQIGLARRESPVKAARLVGLAKTLVHEMPATLAALTAGETSEWRATLVAKETATLELADRKAVDADLGPRLGDLGDRAAGDEARKLAYALDPAQLVKRLARAEADRTVTIRPAPDCMTYLTALLPIAQGVAVHASLLKAAESLRAAGDTRSVGQLKADTLLARITSAAAAGSTDAPGSEPIAPDVSISLVMSDQTLLGESHEPAHVTGFGPIPAFVARRIVDRAAKAWLRRIYTTPEGDLMAADARTRLFPRTMRDVIIARDRWCRTPWCGAPIRQGDHVTRHADGGSTTLDNAQGLCMSCNQVKETPGWRAHLAPGRRHRVVIATPTGHTYTSTVTPFPVGNDGISRGEEYVSDVQIELIA